MARSRLSGFLVATPAAGGGGPASADLFTADYSSLMGSGAGAWDVRPGVELEGSAHTVSRVAGGGPNGLDAIEIALIPGGAVDENFGHRVTIANAGDNVSRFFRWYAWFHPSCVYSDHHKYLMLGDSGIGSRMILNDEPTSGSHWFEGIFDGIMTTLYVPEHEPNSPYDIGEWHSVQLEVAFSSTGDAVLKLWIDNDTYASPYWTTDDHPDFGSLTFTNDANGEISLGAYHNGGISSGTYAFRHAAFRVATTFDSNWHGWRIG